MWHRLNRRPLTTALAAIVLVAAPGYWRVERAVDEAHDAAVDAQAATDRLAELVADLEKERSDLQHRLCDRDVADRVDSRSMWLYVTEELLVPPDVVVAAARQALDVILPELTCNADDVPVPVAG